MTIPLTDVDECFYETHNCDQLCNNTISGFNCSCEEGYMLMNDSVSCEGTSNFLVMVNSWPVL